MNTRNVSTAIVALAGAVVLAVAAAIVAPLLTGCIPVVLDERGNIEHIGFPPPPATRATATAEASGMPSAAMMGSPLTAGSWRVTVLRARTSAKGPGGVKAGAGKEFLLIDTEFKNVKISETLVVRPKTATLTGPSGKVYPEWGARSGYNGRGMRPIGPGYGGSTTFAYRIPTGATGFVFTFAPKVAGKRVKLQWGVP